MPAVRPRRAGFPVGSAAGRPAGEDDDADHEQRDAPQAKLADPEAGQREAGAERDEQRVEGFDRLSAGVAGAGMRATELVVTMPHLATTGTRPRKTQRQPKCSPTTAAAAGPASDGTTQAVDAEGEHPRSGVLEVLPARWPRRPPSAAAPAPTPCTSRAATSSSIEWANPPSRSPVTNSTTPTTNEDDRPDAVTGAPRHHDADQLAQEEGAEHPAVQPQVTQAALHPGHDHGHGQGLRRHQGDEQHEAHREHPPTRRPHPAGERLGGWEGGRHGRRLRRPPRTWHVRKGRPREDSNPPTARSRNRVLYPVELQGQDTSFARPATSFGGNLGVSYADQSHGGCSSVRLEHRVVVADVAGSNPVSHPIGLPPVPRGRRGWAPHRPRPRFRV